LQVIGVFKGGGAKGALYSGALRAVSDRGISFSQVAGSSAGAITAAFVAAGATPDDLRDIEQGGRRLLAMPSGVSGAFNLRSRYGLLSFDDLRRWIADHLNELLQRVMLCEVPAPGGPTFAELRDVKGVPLHIAAVDLRWRSPVVFNAELTPHLPIADAAAASSAIPFVFEAPFLPRGSQLRGAPLLSDGGVMSNLPLFIFTDASYRVVAGLDEQAPTDPIVAFSFVDDETPRHTTPDGMVGNAYRQRFADRVGVTTFSHELHEAAVRLGVRSGRRQEQARNKREIVRRPIHRAAALTLNAILRTVELVVLPPLSWLMSLVRHSTAGSFASRAQNPRVRRWVRFADDAFDVAPGTALIGIVLLVPVLFFGIPAVVTFLWPDWSSLFSSRTFGEAAFGAFAAVIQLVVAGAGLVVVTTLVVLGLVAYVAGWVAKPVAAQLGSDLVATFMRNPQEPPWVGADRGDVVLIRLKVPRGWTALKSTDKPDDMDHELELVRASVDRQLADAGLGTTPGLPHENT
jgi:NTE family protein